MHDNWGKHDGIMEADYREGTYRDEFAREMRGRGLQKAPDDRQVEKDVYDAIRAYAAKYGISFNEACQVIGTLA